ncbi:tRNA (guanosine(46)-N7)-methyltransferase TrmB [Leeia sp. TBRC 13508]|uniref:tRNA (guanine-N(7)-)-methyltransferase n=1 Tax=Leeia speluncae TaxID=2884804 RepID=A0ABS8D8P3_9NEIS|nr:tRNA (guanosine(46)-N7)-methyltransferase TrmB [Leeia speluncae]MCB6184497.1 tRNA (guanosine(46)-N7)-methyltransferase TrmB [Leeia speluncae]
MSSNDPIETQPEETKNEHGHIKSFVRRAGRVTEGQQRALNNLWPTYGIAYEQKQLVLDAAFGRQAPCVLEIGFGMGGATAEIAAAAPETDYLALEIHPPGVGNLLKLIEEKSLNNIRIIQHDAVEVLRDMIPEGSLAGVHIYFPDPWHKKRHNKRRLIQSPFIANLVKYIKPGGYLHCATDWEDYAIQMLEVLSAEQQLQNTADGYAPRPEWRPLTKFEQRGIRLGHGVWDLLFTKK